MTAMTLQQQNHTEQNCEMSSYKSSMNVSCKSNRRRRNQPYSNMTVVASTVRNTLITVCIVLLQLQLLILNISSVRAEDNEQQNNNQDDYFVDDYFIDSTNETDTSNTDESSSSESYESNNNSLLPFWYTTYTAGAYNINNNENWIKGITYSILATIVGGASKLAIRKSWLLAAEYEKNEQLKLLYYNEQQNQKNQKNDQQHMDVTTKSSIVDDENKNDKDTTGRKELQQQQNSNPIDTNTGFEYYGCTDTNTPYPCHTVDMSQPEEHQHSSKTTIIEPNSNNDTINFQKYQYQPNSTSNMTTDESILSLNSSGRLNCCYCYTIRWYRILRFFAMIGVGIVNPFLCVLAMRYVSPSIGAPFAGLTMAWILLLSGPLLKEYPTFIQWIACSLIVLGEILIALFGDHTNGQYNVNNSTIITSTAFTSTGNQYYTSNNYDQQQDQQGYGTMNDNEQYNNQQQEQEQQPQSQQQQQFYEYYYANNPIIQSNLQLIQTVHASYFDPKFLIYFLLTGIYMTFVLFYIFYKKSQPEHIVNKITIKLLCGYDCITVRLSSLRRFCWGVSGGTLAGNLNFLKDALIINDAMSNILIEQQSIHDTIYEAAAAAADADGDETDYMEMDQTTSNINLFPSYLNRFRYILYCMTFCMAFFGLMLLVRCMKRYNAPYSATMFVGSYVLAASIMSFVHYNTFEHLHHGDSNLGYILYPAGLIILLSGVFLLMMEEEIQDNNKHSMEQQELQQQQQQQQKQQEQFPNGAKQLDEDEILSRQNDIILLSRQPCSDLFQYEKNIMKNKDSKKKKKKNNKHNNNDNYIPNQNKLMNGGYDNVSQKSSNSSSTDARSNTTSSINNSSISTNFDVTKCNVASVEDDFVKILDANSKSSYEIV